MYQTQTTTNGYQLQTYTFTVKGASWRVTVAATASNPLKYIEVCKTTSNPHGGRIGKTFENWDQVQGAYKCADLKVKLLLIETGTL
jgi:hypothetical protein